jgi:hypothetical protein
MSYRSTAIVALVIPLGWTLLGAACSDSSSSGNGSTVLPVRTCTSDKDCRDLDFLCDPARLLCVQCLSARDCATDDAAVYECNQGTCASYMACTNSLMCPNGQVCDRQRTRCVDCIQDSDCAMMGKCVDNQCRTACASDKDCTAAGMLCDFTNGSCVSCLRNSDCGDGGLSCISGSCQQQLCEPGTTSCLGSGVATCADNGLAWGNLVPCDTPCAVIGRVARCGGFEGGVVLPQIDSSTSGGCGDVIDDMEDGEGYICRGNGRVGQWYTYGTNITPPATPPPPAIPPSPSPTSATRPGSNYAMHLMGSSLTTVTGAALGVDLQLDGATYGTYDATAYSGISFYGKGNVTIDVLIDSAPTTSSTFGGNCVSVCTPAQISRTLTPNWTFYTIPFISFSLGNGGQTPIDKRTLTHIQFRVASAAIPADLWIDDLSFVR